MLQPNVEIGTHTCRISSQNHDAIRQHDGFLDVVGHDEDGAGRHLLIEPEFQQFTAQVLSREDVECGERLVHEKDLRFDDERTGESHPLLHATGEFFRIGSLEPIETNGIKRAQSAFVALDFGNSFGFEGSLDVLNYREPGEQGEALENDGHVGHLPVSGLPCQRSVPAVGSDSPVRCGEAWIFRIPKVRGSR